MMNDVDSVTTTKPPRKVLLETWGCQMNTADSERMLGILNDRNYVVTDRVEEADLVLLNTCHIREKAKHKVLSRLGVLRQHKSVNPAMKIAVTGCVAQAEGTRLLKQAPEIDMLIGPGKIDELPHLLKELEKPGGRAIALGFDIRHHSHDATTKPAVTPRTAAAPSLEGKNEISRFVNIQQGCNNFCTFCVVPFTRGREISRHPDEIIRECEGLIEAGAREITLLGQNVNSYGLDLTESDKLEASARGPFVDILARVAELPGLQRLRFTTSNPHDFSKSLADLFAQQPKLGRYIHLPVQSGNDEVLQRMRRKVTVAEYRERLQWLRSVDPEMAISTDLIVGFPGETDEQFADTLRLVEEAQYSFIFSFKYSPRRNTAAARFQNQISDDVMEQRLRLLNQLQDAITIAQNQAEIGRERQVLFHYESRKEPGIYYGRTEQFRLVRVRSTRNLIGLELGVKVINGNKTALEGSLI